MTREEAIELLNDLIILIKDDQGRDMAIKALGRDYDRALHMAIDGLKAEPVKHGKWTVDEKHTEEIYTNPVYCSVCGKDVVIDYGEYAPYCPNCGAKMRGEEE